MSPQTADQPTMGALGRLAVRTGMVSYEHVMECVAIQKERALAGESVLLGAILIEQHYITAERLSTLLLSQKSPSATVVREAPRTGTFGGYDLLQRLGVFAACDTWKARHRETGRLVILRIMQPTLMQSPETSLAMQRNIKQVLQLNHPSLARIFSAGREEGRSYYTMLFTDGRSLRRVLDKVGSLSPELALAIVRDVAEGLAAAHAKGICHRELRPSDILLKDEGGLLVIGTGLTFEPVQSLDSLIRSAGNMPQYIAPEQGVEGALPDQRSDLFTLGGILYHMLTGTAPYGGTSVADVLLSIETMHRAPTLPEGCAPPACQGLLDRMMAFDPADRFQSANALLDALKGFSLGKVVPPPMPEG